MEKIYTTLISIIIGIIFTISLTYAFKKYYRPLVWNPTPIVFGLLIGMMLSIIYLSQDEKELQYIPIL